MTYPRAPARMTAMTSSAASLTDSARNTTPGWRARTDSMTARPPPPGRWTSSSTTSGAVLPDALDGRLDVDGLADDLHRHVGAAG